MTQSFDSSHRQLIVIGDRVLIRPDLPDERTKVGLYLPQTVVGKEEIRSGHIVSVGPGIATSEIEVSNDEPWRTDQRRGVRYIPMQAEEGDYALFLRKAAFEIKFDGEDLLVVPQSAVLVLLRDFHQ